MLTTEYAEKYSEETEEKFHGNTPLLRRFRSFVFQALP